mmetsp:Transcript_23146/g.53906  ORF Transcript_23146/g.53906 Transcript_23146/m.53906 type:complete len:125 (+) Transcript_23146:317-691(+)
MRPMHGVKVKKWSESRRLRTQARWIPAVYCCVAVGCLFVLGMGGACAAFMVWTSAASSPYVAVISAWWQLHVQYRHEAQVVSRMLDFAGIPLQLTNAFEQQQSIDVMQWGMQWAWRLASRSLYR